MRISMGTGKYRRAFMYSSVQNTLSYIYTINNRAHVYTVDMRAMQSMWKKIWLLLYSLRRCCIHFHNLLCIELRKNRIFVVGEMSTTIFLHSPNPPTTLGYHRLSVAKRNKPVYACLQCYCVSVLDLHPFSLIPRSVGNTVSFSLRCRFSKVSRDASLNVELSKMCVLHFFLV